MSQETWDLDMCQFYENSPVLQSMIPTQNNMYTDNFDQPSHSNYNDGFNQMSSCMYNQASSWNNSHGSSTLNHIATGWNSLEENLAAINFMQVQQCANVQQTENFHPNPFLQRQGDCSVTGSTTPGAKIAQITKQKRIRTAFTTEQINILERQFQKRPYISRDERKVLYEKLCVSDRVIKVWFQNRRLKEKRIQQENLAVQAASETMNIFQGFGISLDIDQTVKCSENMKYYEPISPPDSNEELVELDSLFQPVDPGISLESLL